VITNFESSLSAPTDETCGSVTMLSCSCSTDATSSATLQQQITATLALHSSLLAVQLVCMTHLKSGASTSIENYAKTYYFSQERKQRQSSFHQNLTKIVLCG